MQTAVDRVDLGLLSAVTSPVTLAECLVLPHRLGRADLAREFTELIVRGSHTDFVAIDEEMAASAAALRAHYNLTLPDAFQLAIAAATGCDALLTNDAALTRVAELDVLVLDDYVS